MKVLLNKISTPRFTFILKIACVILTVFVGGLYYYFLQTHYYPSSEEIMPILYEHYSFLLSNSTVDILANPFWLLSYIIYRLLGLSVFSVRIFFTCLYCFIIGFGVVIVIRKQKSISDLTVAALVFVFFAVLLHPFGGASDFGILAPMVYFLYYNTHQLPQIAALLSILLLDIFINCDKRNLKAVTLSLFITQSLYSFLKTDLCYALIFIAPVCVICLIQLWKKSNNHFRLLATLSIALSAIILTRRIPQISSSFIWDNESVGVYSGPFYGATSWLDVSDILNHLVKYAKNLLLYSNSDFSEYPLIGGYSIIFAFRILLLVYGVFLVITNIYHSLKNHNTNKKAHLIDELISWSIALQSCIYIFTSFSDSDDQFRYVWSIVILITILICRNIPQLLEYMSSKYCTSKLYASFLAGVLLVSLNISFAGAGTDKHEETFENELINVCQFISSRKNSNAEADVIGIAPYWLFGRLAIETGEAFFPLGQGKQYTEIDYVVTNVDTSGHSASALRIGLYDDKAIRELYGEPLEVYEQEHINVYVYR